MQHCWDGPRSKTTYSMYWNVYTVHIALYYCELTVTCYCTCEKIAECYALLIISTCIDQSKYSCHNQFNGLLFERTSLMQSSITVTGIINRYCCMVVAKSGWNSLLISVGECMDFPHHAVMLLVAGKSPSLVVGVVITIMLVTATGHDEVLCDCQKGTL